MALLDETIAAGQTRHIGDHQDIHRRWNETVVSITDHGAVGNGTTDVTTAFNNAVTEVINRGGGIVYVPPGRWRITSRVNAWTSSGGIGVDVVGAGMWQTTIVCDAAAAQLRIVDPPVVTSGGRGSRSGGFVVEGNNVATDPMFVGTCSDRVFSEIWVINAAAGGAGFTMAGTQNCVMEKIVVQNCAGDGLRLSHGAGGNVILSPELTANNRNLVSTTNWNTSYPYSGQPQDNKFYGGLCERINTSVGTQAHLHYGGGTETWFFGTRFTVSSTATNVHTPMVRIRADDGTRPPAGLHLVGCSMQGTVDSAATPNTHGYGIDSNVADWSYLTDCTFVNLDAAFVLGDSSRIEIDRYVGNGVTARFRNQSGGTNVEDNLVRVRLQHPVQFNGAATSTNMLLGSVLGEAGIRWQVNAGGSFGWGPGSGGTDLAMYRGGIGRLRVDGRLVARDGLGAGNTAAATTLGSVTRRMEVFDASGNSLGFVPIYNSIT